MRFDTRVGRNIIYEGMKKKKNQHNNNNILYEKLTYTVVHTFDLRPHVSVIRNLFINTNRTFHYFDINNIINIISHNNNTSNLPFNVNNNNV